MVIGIHSPFVGDLVECTLATAAEPTGPHLTRVEMLSRRWLLPLSMQPSRYVARYREEPRPICLHVLRRTPATTARVPLRGNAGRRGRLMYRGTNSRAEDCTIAFAMFRPRT